MQRVLLAIVVSTLAAAVSAQEAPPPESLSRNLVKSLPGWWAVESLEVVATSELGSAVSPRLAIRFEAEAKPEVPLFSQVGEAGPYLLVAQTRDEGEARTLYGYTELTYSAGEWLGDIIVENPVEGLGSPLDQFSRSALIAGQEETDQRLAALSGMLPVSWTRR